MARGDGKRGLNPNLNKESKAEVGVSFSRAQVADDRDGCRSLDEGSSHFQLNLPSPLWPLCRHQRCSCCPSDGAGPGSSPQDGGASTPEWEMLFAACPLRWLLINLTPWAEHSAALKILPRNIRLRAAAPWAPGSLGLAPLPSCHSRLLHAGSPVTGTALHRAPFSPASMPPMLPIHQNSSPNAVSSRESSFSPCLMGQEGSHYPPGSVQPLTTFSIPASGQPFQGKQGCYGSS